MARPRGSEAESRELAVRALGPEDWSVRVLGFRRIDDELWANVEVLSGSICTSAAEPTVLSRGWVPVHGTSGAPNIWFYSRGC